LISAHEVAAPVLKKYAGVRRALNGNAAASSTLLSNLRGVQSQARGSRWLEVEAKQGLKIATQTITFQPGGQSGWHTHPGPVFISVKERTMTFYDENCNATVRMAGEGFLADTHRVCIENAWAEIIAGPSSGMIYPQNLSYCDDPGAGFVINNLPVGAVIRLRASAPAYTSVERDFVIVPSASSIDINLKRAG